jgi:hypothetical protein
MMAAIFFVMPPDQAVFRFSWVYTYFLRVITANIALLVENKIAAEPRQTGSAEAFETETRASEIN